MGSDGRERYPSGYEDTPVRLPLRSRQKLGRAGLLMCAGFVVAPSVLVAAGAMIGDHEPMLEQSVAVAAPKSVATHTEIITFDETDDLRFAVSTAEQSIDAKDIKYTFRIGAKEDTMFSWVRAKTSYSHNKQISGAVDVNYFLSNDAMSGRLDDDKAEVIIDPSQFSVESAWGRGGYDIDTYVGDDPTTDDQANTWEDVSKIFGKSLSAAKVEKPEKLVNDTEQAVERLLQAEALNSLESYCVNPMRELAMETVEENMKAKMVERYDISPRDVNVVFTDENWTWRTPKQDDELSIEDDIVKGGGMFKISANLPEIVVDDIDCGVSADILRTQEGSR